MPLINYVLNIYEYSPTDRKTVYKHFENYLKYICKSFGFSENVNIEELIKAYERLIYVRLSNKLNLKRCKWRI